MMSGLYGEAGVPLRPCQAAVFFGVGLRRQGERRLVDQWMVVGLFVPLNQKPCLCSDPQPRFQASISQKVSMRGHLVFFLRAITPYIPSE